MEKSQARKDSTKRYNDSLSANKKQLRVWLDPAEYTAIETAARAEGLSTAAYVKARCIPGETNDQED